nr:m7GpppN-mRNA hydrolase-like [Pocillopora verrucosa]
MASERDVEPDSPVIPSNSIVPQTILEELCSRFLINIPEEERKDVVRLCFQIETAHWFYVDFYRQERPDLPTCGLKDFTRIIFEQFPFLNKTGENIDKIFENWKKYKYSVPVYGAILLNQSLDKCVLVQSFSSKSWGFPKGKVNKDESGFDCAVREVLEETGFEMRFYADPDTYFEHNFQDHQIRLYVVPGVPEKTVFQPLTRGEIKNIQWFYIDNLPAHKKDTVCRENMGLNPSAFYMVIPFVKNLRKWISARLKEANKPNPEPVASETSRNAQLQNLLAKEEQRLEQEQKRAAVERRRKQQQEKFQLQHDLNHPLRYHHMQQRGSTPKDYQALLEENLAHRSSPVAREKEGTPVFKILQRPTDESYTEEPFNPIQKLLSGSLGFGPVTAHQPFPPLGAATPERGAYPPYHHMHGVIGVHREHLSPGTPLMSSRSKQPETSPSEHSWEDKEFQFTSPAFLNFTFDTKSILACLPT